MNDEPTKGTPPGDVPPRRRLDRAPSERFGARDPDPVGGDAADDAAVMPWLRGARGALGAAALGALAVVIVYGVLATTIGLLAIAGVTGFVIGLALRGTSGAGGRGAVIAASAMVLGIVGSWAVSLGEGGVAGPIDYIGQTLGLLTLIVPVVAAVAAWLGSR